MANYIVSDSDLTSVANAIRAKGSTSASLTWPNGFVSAVSAFPDAVKLSSLSITENGTYTASSGHGYSQVTVDVAGGGGDSDEELSAIIARTISGSYTNSTVSLIGSFAFMQCSFLSNAHFTECNEISASAFCRCYALKSFDAPKCSVVNEYAFANCSKLESANLPLCSEIKSSAFINCASLTTAYFPNCTDIGSSAFYSCTKLSNVVLPVCTNFGYQIFTSCLSLTKISLPEMTVITNSVFLSCRNLSFAVFQKASNIKNGAFMGCNKLISLYLLSTSVVALSNASNTFGSTPIHGYTVSTGGKYGSVYVRASLLTAFQSATNWTYYSSQIVGLTDEEIAELEGA